MPPQRRLTRLQRDAPPEVRGLAQKNRPPDQERSGGRRRCEDLLAPEGRDVLLRLLGDALPEGVLLVLVRAVLLLERGLRLCGRPALLGAGLRRVLTRLGLRLVLRVGGSLQGLR